MTELLTYYNVRCQFCGTDQRVLTQKKACATCNSYNLRAEKNGIPLLKPIELSRIMTVPELLQDEEYLAHRAAWRAAN